jgi:hypothetical protein
MGRVVGLAAALALAACQVDVDGAVCAEPGTTTDCPSGQACGNDLRCSARALGCVATRCTPGPVFCAARDGTEAYGCVDADPVCGAPAKVSCFDSLGEALAKAAAHARESGAPTTVSIQGGPGADVVFGLETGEVFPLEVAEGVTLVGAGAPAGASVIRAGEAPSILAVSGAVRGLRVESEGAAGTGIAVSCGSGGTVPTLVDVVVDGSNALTRGLSVTSACGVQATNLHVANVAGPGIYVDAELATVSVPAVGARIDSGLIEVCRGAGAEVRGGALTLNGVVLRRNAGFGVSARTRDDAPKRAIALVLEDVTSEENDEAGLLVRAVAEGSSVQVLRSTFRWNKARTKEETEFVSGRRAGGVYLYGTPPATLVFQGNRVYGNAGSGSAIVDQLVTFTGASWNLAGALDCGILANVFACPGNGQLVYGNGGKPSVENAYWPTDPPESWPPVSLVVNADFDPTCPFSAAPIPRCTP